MDNILIVLKTIVVFMGIIITYIGLTPAIIIAAIITFVVPAIILAVVLLYILISRFDIKKLFCLIGVYVFSYLCYFTIVTDLGSSGLDNLVNTFFYSSLFALLDLISLWIFFIYDSRIRRIQREATNTEKEQGQIKEKNT